LDLSLTDLAIETLEKLFELSCRVLICLGKLE
jgi:hypothetical protein